MACLTLLVNGVQRTTTSRCVEQLLGELGLRERSVALEKNGDIVPRSRFAAEPLEDGDRLEIVSAIGGG